MGQHFMDMDSYTLILTKDSLSVGDDDGPDVGLRPVLEHVVHVPLVVDSDEQALHIQQVCVRKQSDRLIKVIKLL